MPTFADDLIPGGVFLPELSPEQEGRGGFGRSFTGPGGSPGVGAGLPAIPIIPVPGPTPAPTLRIVRPIRPPTLQLGGPAANDPVFSRALPFLRIGSAAIGVAAFIDFAVREAQEESINRQQAEREAVDELVARRLGADNPLAVIEISSPLDQPAPPGVEFAAPPRPTPFELPAEVSAPPIEIPQFPSVEIPTTLPEIVQAPLEIPAPTPAPTPTAAPSSAPLPAGTPGIGTGVGVFAPPARAPFSFPRSSPVSFPQFPPVQSPKLQPVGDPLTPFVTPEVPSTATPFDVGNIELPQTQPQPQNQRCPAPKRKRKKRPERRDACFKGLYREGPFDDQISFTEFAEIDCSSGRELGKRKRPTGAPNLRLVETVAEKIIGG